MGSKSGSGLGSGSGLAYRSARVDLARGSVGLQLDARGARGEGGWRVLVELELVAGEHEITRVGVPSGG